MNASPPTPGLSIVVVPFGGEALLGRCLDALEGQTARTETEILVVGDRRHDFEDLRVRFPGIGFDRIAGRRTWAEMRAAAVRQARAPVVALTEAQCIPDRDWAARILAQHGASPGSEQAAIGGVVAKQEGTIVGWAMYFCDYARYAPPLPGGPATTLTDCNVSYKRAALEGVSESWVGEFHEPTVHAALSERGGKLWLTPEIVVHHARAPRLGEALRDRFRFGRLFAATRTTLVGPGRRLLLAAAAPVVPPLVVGRVVVEVLRRRRHLGRLLVSAPVMTLLAVVWALGELIGTVTGHPGALAEGAPPDEASP